MGKKAEEREEALCLKCSVFSVEGPLLLLLKAFTVLAGGVIGVKQTVFNTQELELPRSFGRWILNYLVIHQDIWWFSQGYSFCHGHWIWIMAFYE
ncbi:hypothetical protein A4D02_12560 [Niastella koreensis]|uniref:Uncharacterized protein n=1 Tax=Niastella koreensis TaxID=354356 RepID=A0ABX3NQ72_9BACT|nr:hypothetical protein A4D02_12560 [Niastella koreensis]